MANDEPQGWAALKKMASVGPERYIFRRITQYIIGAVIGAAVAVADLVESAIGVYETALIFAGEQLGLALLPDPQIPGELLGRGGQQVTLANWASIATGAINGVLRAMTGVLGPLAYPVLLFVGVASVALLIRTLVAISDSIPIVSSIVKFIEG